MNHAVKETSLLNLIWASYSRCSNRLRRAPAPNSPPTPSGIRVPVTEFAQQRQKEAMRKKEEAKLNFGKDRVTRNFSFGYEETEQ